MQLVLTPKVPPGTIEAFHTVGHVKRMRACDWLKAGHVTQIRASDWSN